MTKILTDYQEEATSLCTRKKQAEADFEILMSGFITKLFQKQFPGIQDLSISFEYRTNDLNIDWSDAPDQPSLEDLNDFLDEMCKQYQFNKL